MADYLFQRMDKIRGLYRPSQGDTLAWFRQTARDLVFISGTTPAKVMQAKDVISFDGMSREVVGSMVAYYYEAKTADKLKYWDAFPVVFVVDLGNGFHYGINCHYLPMLARAKLMDALYTLVSDRTLDTKARLRISYQILKTSTRFREYKICFKKYLWDHVRSQFKRIHFKDWDYALTMPAARFMKASEERVWEDSLKIIRSTIRPC